MFINVLLLILFIVITGIGFFQGTIKLMISLITFYFSVVLASLYFKFMALFFVRRGTTQIVADALSFFLILAVCFILLLAMALYTFRYIRLPGRLELLDRVGGVFLGVVLGVVACSILAMILQYAFITYSAGNAYPITRAIQASTRKSVMVQLLIYNILPRLFTVIAPFLPDAAIPFFSPS